MMANYLPLLNGLYEKNKKLLEKGILDAALIDKISKVESVTEDLSSHFERKLYVCFDDFFGMCLTLPTSHRDKLSFEINGKKFRLIWNPKLWQKLCQSYEGKMKEATESEKITWAYNMENLIYLWGVSNDNR